MKPREISRIGRRNESCGISCALLFAERDGARDPAQQDGARILLLRHISFFLSCLPARPRNADPRIFSLNYGRAPFSRLPVHDRSVKSWVMVYAAGHKHPASQCIFIFVTDIARENFKADNFADSAHSVKATVVVVVVVVVAAAVAVAAVAKINKIIKR